MKEKIKSLLFSIFIALLITSAFMFAGFSFRESSEHQQELRFESDNKICNDIGLEFLSESRQIFGDDYITCYNNITKEIKEIRL